MTFAADLVVRDVEVAGHPNQDVALAQGRIIAIGLQLAAKGPELDGQGGALIPGLIDHHIHLFGLAAQAHSMVLDDLKSRAQFRRRMLERLSEHPLGSWVRATGYHEAMAGDLDRDALDFIAPNHRLRVQHQTGSLWILNSAALDAVCGSEPPPGVETDGQGRPTGRVWRSDAWLRERIGADAPPLAPIGRRLASFGITAVTDASVTTDQDTAGRLAQAVLTGELPLQLSLMSGGALEPPVDGGYRVGPVKILLDDHALPQLSQIIDAIGLARVWRRSVAVHCVTAGELAITLAAFGTAGSRPGDRIEHGGMIPREAIAVIAALGLTVVTQPGFIRERGDRYLREIPAEELGDLYRCGSLLQAGIPTAASSDAPYATPDPWIGIAAAIGRSSLKGRRLGSRERLSAKAALGLYLGSLGDPGGAARRVSVGERADICLLRAPLRDMLASPSAENVRATLLGGEITYHAKS